MRYFCSLLFLLLSFAGSAATYSGTLPVVHLTTLSGNAIVSKEDYVSAIFWIDSVGLGQPAPFASSLSPDTCLVKGRGNWTWRGFNKKPYRIKLNAGAKLLGMDKSKHWALMAAADDNLGFLKNPVGYMLSRRLGLKWTPSEKPVELVLNNEYVGLYFLTEVIRVDKKRVAVTEQADLITNSDSITGGWLIEIDNYEEPNRVDIQESNGEQIHITPKSPENLSQPQRDYLTSQMEALNSAFYDSKNTDWGYICDLREAARFYLVQELMVDCESYHGSCYLHKDMDLLGDTKWYFGPVWDFGNAFNRLYYGGSDDFIFQHPEFSQVWIGQMYQSPEFRSVLMEEWYRFYHDIYPSMEASIRAYASSIQQAAKADARRWGHDGQVCSYSDIMVPTNKLISYFHQHTKWLHRQWGEGKSPSAVSDVQLNRQAELQMHHGQLFILRDGNWYDLTGARYK